MTRRNAAFFISLLGVAVLPEFSAASELDLICQGETDGWHLELEGDEASLTLVSPTEMSVMDETRADAADWPRALTLIGDNDTAILILDPRACMLDPQADYSAELLTQRANSPIFLTGCCRIAE